MPVETNLDPVEARVFAVLIEKALTTPEQYPLSVNATTNGANQRSNRDPVLSLGEDEVSAALGRLAGRYLARRHLPAGGRVERYGHNAREALGLAPAEQAIVAELLLRGPQTVGELRTRAGRMTPLPSLEAVVTTLTALRERQLVERLPPAPGTRAERWAERLRAASHGPDASTSPRDPIPDAASTGAPAPNLVARVEALEVTVERLERRVAALTTRPREGAPE